MIISDIWLPFNLKHKLVNNCLIWCSTAQKPFGNSFKFWFIWLFYISTCLAYWLQYKSLLNYFLTGVRWVFLCSMYLSRYLFDHYDYFFWSRILKWLIGVLTSIISVQVRSFLDKKVSLLAFLPIQLTQFLLCVHRYHTALYWIWMTKRPGATSDNGFIFKKFWRDALTGHGQSRQLAEFWKIAKLHVIWFLLNQMTLFIKCLRFHPSAYPSG